MSIGDAIVVVETHIEAMASLLTSPVLAFSTQPPPQVSRTAPS
jgi:hypothetical protein